MLATVNPLAQRDDPCPKTPYLSEPGLRCAASTSESRIESRPHRLTIVARSQGTTNQRCLSKPKRTASNQLTQRETQMHP
jgi:hypothetical protein